MKYLGVAVIALLLSGCSTSPVSYDQAQPVPPDRLHDYQQSGADMARLSVTRDSGILGSACMTDTMIDGKLSAEIKPGEIAAFQVPPGRHIIGAKPQGICGGGLIETEVRADAGQQYRYRISINSTGSMRIAPTAY